MEYSKNAMYQRAGRERGGWVQDASAEDRQNLAAMMMTAPAPAEPIEIPAMPADIPAIMPETQVVPPEMPVMHMETPNTPPEMIIEIPAPPKVEMPECAEELCTTPVMAYVPLQKWEDLYEAEAGLGRGTIFAQLDLPFVGEGACRYE